MPPKRAVVIVPRKRPKQARSSRLVEAILQAAVRVLEREGAAGFTTVRVAERAGVSVGSLYQYFPNKEALVGALIEHHVERINGAMRVPTIGDFHMPSWRKKPPNKQDFLKRRTFEEGCAQGDAAHIATQRLYCGALRFWI